MKSRKEVVKFICIQFEKDLWNKEKKHGKLHYGKNELKDLLDYIYEGKPKHKDEELVVEFGWIK